MKNQKEILKEIVEKIPKVDFKEIYAVDLYERLKKEADPKIQEVIREKLNGIQITDDVKSVIVAENIIRAADNLKYGVMVDSGKTAFLYNGKHWESIVSLDLKHFLGKVFQKLGADKYTASNIKMINKIHEQYCYSLYKSMSTKHEEIKINLQNKTLVLKEGKTTEQSHLASDYFFYILPYKYDSKAKCPLFHKFLDEVLPEKTVQSVLQEFIGSCLDTSIKLEKVLCCIGTGSNGKSVLFETITAVLGEENVSSYNINSLCDEKGYSRIMIKTKLLNYSSDFNGKIWNNGIFKQLASGEPVEARRLYQEPEIVRSYARLAFNCNTAPTSQDSSHGFRRRLLMIPFNKKITPDMADPMLSKKLQKELPGILLWAIEGLHRFQKNGRKLSKSATIDAMDREYKKETDSVVMFLESKNYIPSKTNFRKLGDLHAEYQNYCKDNSLKFETKSTLKSKLKDEGYEVEEKGKTAIQVGISSPFSETPFKTSSPAPKEG